MDVAAEIKTDHGPDNTERVGETGELVLWNCGDKSKKEKDSETTALHSNNPLQEPNRFDIEMNRNVSLISSYLLSVMANWLSVFDELDVSSEKPVGRQCRLVSFLLE